MPPPTHLCSSLYRTSRRTVQWVHKLELLWTTPLASTVVAGALSGIPQLSILDSTQLWSKLNYQCKPCSILNSTQQHSFCILIRSDLSSMHSVSLNTAQLNSARQLVSLSYHVFDPLDLGSWIYFNCNCNLLTLSTSQQKASVITICWHCQHHSKSKNKTL